MESPFLQNVADIFSNLRGRSLIIVAVVWVLILGLGLTCAFGGIKLPGRSTPATQVEPSPTIMDNQPQTVVPTVNSDGFVTLPTPTPLPAAATTVAPTSDDAGPSSGSSLPSLPWGAFGYGIAAHGIYLPEDTMNQVKNQLNLTWVKQQVRWDHFSAGPGQMDWSGYDPVVNAAHEQGLNVMLSIVGAPNWSRSYFDSNPEAAPPDDFTAFTAFLVELVERYKGKVQAIEVWNEQNLDREWDTAEGVNAARYVELLRLAYQTIKSRDPSIIVISGALSPTGATFTDPDNPNRYTVMDDFLYFQQMIDAGFLDVADCVGAHHNGINMPPDVAWDEGYDDPTATYRGPFDGPHHSWSFKSTLWGYHEMIQAAGYSTPLCVTEFGWATAEGFDGYPPGFEFAQDNTLEEQALWDVQAFQLMRQWGFVQMAFLWNLDYSVKGGNVMDPNAPYSIVDMIGAPRPAFGAIAEMPKIP